MTDLGAVVAQLKKERDKLGRATAALSASLEAVEAGVPRKLYAAARERIAAAKRARWAKFKAKKK